MVGFLFPLLMQAQIMGRKPKDMFPEKRQYKQGFWYFGPGITYSLPSFTKKETFLGNSGGAEVYSKHKSSGIPGLYAEFGRYQMINNSYWFRYFNYGVNWRWIQGKEQFNNEMRVGDVATPAGGGTSKFSDHFANAHIEIHNVIYINDYNFFDNGIGVNAGYAVISQRNGTNTLAGSTQSFAEPFTAYFYYKFGYGMKVSKKLIITPSLEIPLLTLNGFTGRWDLPYFNSHFWPLTISLRFMPFGKRPWADCPPVKSIELPEGFDPDEPKKH